MKPLLLVLFHAALATGGYFAGARLLGNSAPAENSVLASGETAPDDSDTADADGLLRDPRTSATFAESRENLESLAMQAAAPQGSTRQIFEGDRNERSRLEIDRTFALATQEEMLAFFAGEDLSELDEQVLSAAYARLATLAPEEAAAIWTERHQREGDDTGVAGLVHAWALQAPAAAEAWVDALPESSTLRDQALFALLNAAMDSDPGLAMRRFNEVEDFERSIDLTGQLAWTLDPADFPAFAERILSGTRGQWSFQKQLATALEIWAEQDAVSALAWLKEQPAGKFKYHVIPRLAQGLLKNGDPASIARELGPAADNRALAPVASQAWMAWLASGVDDEGALAWLQEHGEHLEFAGGGRWDQLSWTAERAAQVLPRLATISDITTRNSLVQSILDQLANTDPLAALQHAGERLPPGDGATRFIADTVRKLASQESPATAMEWTLENLPADESRGTSVRFLMSTWAETDPRAATDRARSLPEDLRDLAFHGIFSHWAQIAPDQVFDYLKTADDPSAVQALAKSALVQIGFYQGGQATLDQALALPGSGMRSEAVPALIGGWAQANLEDAAAALNQLEKGPVRDASIEQFVGTAALSDRESALTWSLAIGDTGKRRQVTMKEARSWLNADRNRATRWIESADALPTKWKGQLLGQE